MRGFVKSVFAVLLASVLVFSLSACTHKTHDPDGPDTPPSTDPDNRVSESPTNTVISGENLSSIRIYTVDADSESVVSKVVMVRANTEVTPSLILEYLADSFKDESLKISFDSVDFSNETCIVSFTDSIYSIASQSVGLEEAVLDATAQSILDNVDGCLAIVFRINNGAYETSNFTFDLNYVYMDD